MVLNYVKKWVPGERMEAKMELKLKWQEIKEETVANYPQSKVWFLVVGGY